MDVEGAGSRPLHQLSGGGNQTLASLPSTCIQNVMLETQQGKDGFQCGVCLLLFHDLKEFLRHKATHVGRGAGMGCELCDLLYSRERPLIDHYRTRHAIRLQLSKTEQNLFRNQVPQRDVAKSQKRTSSKPAEKLKPSATDSTANPVRDTMAGQTNMATIYKKQNHNNIVIMTAPVTHSSFLDTVDAVTQLNTSASNVQQNSLGTTTASIDGNIGILPAPEHCSNITTASTAGKSLDNDKSKANCAPVLDNDALVFHIDPSNVMQDRMSTITATKDEEISDHPPEGSSANDLNMPDFHFVSRITHKSGASISYGKHYFKCLYCDTQTYWRNAMCRHMKEKHSEILSLQPYLDVNPDSVTDGQVIVKMSEYISRHKLKVKKLRRREKQDMPGDFPCHLCDKVFYRLRYLRVHVKTHQAGEQHLCPVCGKPFKLKLYLTQHMRTHMDKESFKCNECDFTSDINHLIHAHRQIHSQGSVLCDVCGLAYSDKSTLVKHRRVHDNTRPYCCTFPGCTWRFNTEALCQGHFKAHTMEGKFVCHICGYAFRKKHHLTRHKKKQHDMLLENRSNLSCDDLTVSAVEVRENQSVDTGSICGLNIHEGNIVNIHEDGIAVTVENMITSDTIVNNEHIGENTTLVDDQLELENALQSGQLVIATEVGYGEEANMNYEMSDLDMHASYRMLMQPHGEIENSDKGILIPQTDGSHIYFQHEATETVASETHCIDTHI